MALPAPPGAPRARVGVSGYSAGPVVSVPQASALVAAGSPRAAFPTGRMAAFLDPVCPPPSVSHRGPLTPCDGSLLGPGLGTCQALWAVSGSEPGWRLQGAAVGTTRPSFQPPPASSGPPSTRGKA